MIDPILESERRCRLPGARHHRLHVRTSTDETLGESEDDVLTASCRQRTEHDRDAPVRCVRPTSPYPAGVPLAVHSEPRQDLLPKTGEAEVMLLHLFVAQRFEIRRQPDTTIQEPDIDATRAQAKGFVHPVIDAQEIGILEKPFGFFFTPPGFGLSPRSTPSTPTPAVSTLVPLRLTPIKITAFLCAHSRSTSLPGRGWTAIARLAAFVSFRSFGKEGQ